MVMSVGATLVSNAPSPFSEHNPNHQLVWDSTSLKALQFCPTYYKNSIIDGYRVDGESLHLDFGIFFASGVETFKKARVEGKTKEEATLLAIKRVVEVSWITDPNDADDHMNLPGTGGHPWGGHYEAQWHCTGTTKYKNEKGNAAKCPLSHKGHWVPGNGPSICGRCGSPTETTRRYLPTNNAKNRHTLVRLIAWYCEEQPDTLDTGFHALKFPNGKIAVELSFKIPLPYQTKQGEYYILAGHIDSLMTDGNETFFADNKTTKNAINASYWKQFNPNTQFSTYDLGTSLLYPSLEIRGGYVEAAQVLVEGARFAVQPIYYSAAQREEYFIELKYWFDLAERMAEENYWPMNRSNCKICPFNGICSKEPAKRQAYLDADFVKRPWNPLEER